MTIFKYIIYYKGNNGYQMLDQELIKEKKEK